MEQHAVFFQIVLLFVLVISKLNTMGWKLLLETQVQIFFRPNYVPINVLFIYHVIYDLRYVSEKILAVI